MCQHHFPENFWNPAFQAHANGGETCRAWRWSPKHPTDHQIFLKAFTGVRDLHSSSTGIKACTENGDVEIMEQVAFRDRFGVSTEVGGEGMTLNALRFAVADVTRSRRCIARMESHRAAMSDGFVVPPDVAHGATLIFEAAQEG